MMKFRHHTTTAFLALALAPAAAAQISFQGATTYTLNGFRPDWVASGDFDGVNGPDFAVSTGQNQGANGPEWVEIFNNQGNGNFLAGQVILLGNNVGSAAIVPADLDGDHDLDLAVSLKNVNTVQVLLNNGGTFVLGGSVAVGGSEPRHMAGGDIDGDGAIDLIASNRNSNNLAVLRNNGAGSFSLSGTVAVGLEPRHLSLADLNGDCDLDIALAAQDARAVQVLLNTGGGNFAAPQNYPIPGNNKPSGLCTVDLDHDGDMDLATTTDNNNVGQVVVYLNNGSGGFASAVYITNSQNPDAILAADFDADGDKDLATADEATNVVSALANGGLGSFAPGITFAVGLHPAMLACADFDGNGSIDLVSANRDTNNVSVLLNAQAGGAKAYCEAARNSVGAGAQMDTYGSLSVGANGFHLTARCVPANQPGIFFYGNGQKNTTFGNGRLCVNGTLFRLNPPSVANGAGFVDRYLDFTQPPANSGAGQISAGATWNFQLWYRDPAGGGAFFNTTNALSATFTL